MLPIGHSSQVNSANYSPDGKFVVTASGDNTAKIWDVVSGKEIQSLEGHTLMVLSANYSPDGKFVVTTSIDNTAKIWNVVSGKEILSLEGHSLMVLSANYSPDGKFIVTASRDKTVKIWDVVSGKEIQNLEGHSSQVNSANYSPDGKFVVTASGDNTAKIWDVVSGKEIQNLEGHSSEVSSANYSPDGKFVVTTSGDKTAKIWDVVSGKEIQNLEGHSSHVNSANYSPDGKFIVTASWDKAAKIWEVVSGDEIQSLEGHTLMVLSANYSPDGKFIVTTSWGKTAKILDAATGKETQSLVGHSSQVNSANYSPDGKFIVTASGDKTVKIWDVVSGDEIQSLESHSSEVSSANYSPDGKFIVTASGDKTVKIWDVVSGDEIQSLEGHSGFVKVAIYSPDGKFIVTASWDKTAKIWDVASGKEIQSLEGHSDQIWSANYNPDGKFIVTASRDKTMKIWDTVSGEEVQSFEAQYFPAWSVNYSPDGKYIVTTSWGKTAKIWDVVSGEEIQSLEGHSSSVSSANYSPDGKYVVTTGMDGFKIHLTETGKQLLSLTILTENNWVVVHRSGLFDASKKAMEWMYYLVRTEVIEFDQLKERYYEPGLYQKVMNGEPLRDVEAMKSLEMYPLIDAILYNKQINVNLKERNGGIGKVSLFINDKEVRENANPNKRDSFSIDLTQYNKFYRTDTTNTISIRSWNEEGWLKSAPYDLEYNYTPKRKKGEGDSGGINLGTKKHNPELYGIIIGTSDYSGDKLDLKFADKDAAYMYKAISQSSKALFGAEKTHIKYLSTNTTDVALLASKKNIKEAFQSFSNANPEDILFIYLSGHGMSYEDQFYYLTKDVSSANGINDPGIRENYTISSNELTDWITDIPAQKQVLVIDACSSGTFIEDLSQERDISSDQVRALDRMKDRTGMFVLAGSASDKVSYEASQYGQGVLTYSLLSGMRGQALRDNEFVDVSELFQFAKDEVPKLAQDIGGIQSPSIFYPPDASSFDIGIVNEEVEIPLEDIKPVFELSNFQERIMMDDVLDLGTMLDDHLESISHTGGKGIIFVPARKVKNAFRINGNYELEGELIQLRCNLVRERKIIGEFELKGDKKKLQQLVEEITLEIGELVGTY